MTKRMVLLLAALALLVSGTTAVALLVQQEQPERPAQAAQAAPQPASQNDGPLVEVWKTPTCGCCGIWVAHLEQNGFSVNVNDVPSTRDARQKGGVPRGLGSCHTAFVDGYVVEGHVPAEDIRRLLAERPDVAGIGVPGMPIGSPGMEGPNPQPYDVLAFDDDGALSHFASH